MILDPTAEQVYAFVRRTLDRTGQAPTVSEIGRACYLPTTTVFYALRRLQSLDIITIEKRKTRGIRILE